MAMTTRTARKPKSKAAPGAKPRQAAMFYFLKKGDSYLLTNDWGHYANVSEADFRRLLAAKLSPDEPLWQSLQEKGFIQDHLDFEALSRSYRQANSFLFRGPALHIFVTTLRCNHACVYCQSSAVKDARPGLDMSLETARQAVDFVFQSSSEQIVIEFQGGEPLLNWPVVQFCVRYARTRNAVEKKRLRIALVSNLSLMDEEKLGFLLENEVSICTSLDGPAELHDLNRPFSTGASHELATRWIAEIRRRHDAQRDLDVKVFRPSALVTITRDSLAREKEIVDEYVRLKLEDIFLRPLSPIGYAKRSRSKIGYAPQEFLAFYARALDYILELNRSGVDLVERGALILLKRILKREDPGFYDLRSPCGASVGQLAYGFDGSIYTCDEGRMVAQQGDPLFKLGNLRGGTYRQLLGTETCRAVCAASNQEGQPSCSRCVYKPYCGICPVHNYEAQGSLGGAMPSADYCAIRKGMFDILFDRIDRPECRKVFEDWLKPGEGGAHAATDATAKA